MTIERTLLLFLVEVTAKAAAVVVLTALVCWWLRRGSAALRHFIWAVTLAGVLALPPLALFIPDWRVALLPAPPSSEALVSAIAERPSRSVPARPLDAPIAPVGSLTRAQRSGSRAALPIPNSVNADGRIAPGSDTDRAFAETPVPIPHRPIDGSRDRQMLAFLVLALWIGGATIALGRLLAGHVHLWWMGRRADPITDPAWVELARRVAEQLREAAPSGLGTARLSAIRLLRCRRPTMPVCWGVRRPSLLLPSVADSWTAERRRIVLLHELAHAKRRDCLTQALAQLAIAVHWFNPLVWLAVRLLRAERERACDDLVLASGASAPDYADHLLDIARAFRTAGCPSWAAVAMARPSQLEGRLLAILDRHRDRRALTRPSCVAAGVLAFATVGVLAAVQPARESPAPDGQSSAQRGSKNQAATSAGRESSSEAAPVLAGAQRAPVPPPRPPIAPKIDLTAPIAVADLAADAGDADVAGNVAVAADVTAVFEMDRIDIATVARDAALSVDTEAIAALAGEKSSDRIAQADDRPEADPKIVAALATALKDNDVEVRRQAASTLAELRSAQALDALIGATTDADKEVRKFAVNAISRHRSDAVTQALVRALKDNDAEVRRTAMHGVARLRDPKYMDVFMEAFKSGDPEVRKLALHTLSGFRDGRTVPTLVTALKDADAEVRQAAIRGVARLRDPQYVDVLTAALKDEDAEVRATAAHGLAQMRDVRAVPGLIAALKDATAAVRQYAAHALGQIGDARAVDPLVSALKDTEDEVREVAVLALGQIGRRAGGRERK